MIINLDEIQFGNKLPFVLIGGINVIESETLALETAKEYKRICNKLGIPIVFKASYDKANRSSINSFRGPGLFEGIKILKKIKENTGLKIITDVHTSEEANVAAEVCDIIQLPAFLARQTDLIDAIAKTNKVVNVKKPQFLSPEQTASIIEKFKTLGNPNVLLCERGSMFGYDNLIVDFLGFGVMKRICSDAPLIFDVTHSLQCRNPTEKVSNGRRSQVLDLAKSGLSQGIAGLFLESHPEPSKALCDGPSALPLDLLEPFLKQLKEIDQLIKSLPELRIN